MLDYNYGDLYNLMMASKEYDIIKSLYDEILFQVYYFAFSTMLLIILAYIYYKIPVGGINS